jgi:hypothetical protein
MRRVSLLLALALGLVALAAPRPALAADVYGTWKSTSGNVFEITDSRRGGFKLRLTYPNGTQEVLRGDWVPGMEGLQFNYWNRDNVQHVATFSRRDPDRVRVQVGTTVSWWQRVSHAVAVPAHKAKIFGFWRSSSGNVFEITEAHRGGFKLWVTMTSGKRMVLRGDWVRGLSGSQFTYWEGKYQYTGTFSPDDPDRVRVVAPGNVVTWWQRYDAAAPPPPPPPPPYDCWSAEDPGCYRTKAGFQPMDRAAYGAFYQHVAAARPHVFRMVERVKTGLGAGYLTVRQLANLLELLKPHIFPMLDVVKLCAPRLVDPEGNGALVAARFHPHRQVAADAAAIVNAQRADRPRR